MRDRYDEQWKTWIRMAKKEMLWFLPYRESNIMAIKTLFVRPKSERILTQGLRFILRSKVYNKMVTDLESLLRR
jgi:hypothetical protein